MDLEWLLAKELFVHPDEVRRLIRNAPRRYKVYRIPKKSGTGYRIIAQPSKEVKRLQQYLLRNIIRRWPVHQAATAYRKGRGIKGNAAAHANSRFLLRLDFESFFPSIKSSDLITYLDRHKIDVSTEEKWALQRILFWQPRRGAPLELAIGAPSSPDLSNVLLVDFDVCLKKLLPAGVTYTRYADDMNFSTDAPGILASIPEVVTRACREAGYPSLFLNTSKTIFSSKRHRRRVTGLILTNEGGVSIGRERKRLIRAQVHRYITGRLTDDQVLTLAGTLAFVNGVEPDFTAKLNKRYPQAVSLLLRKCGSTRPR